MHFSVVLGDDIWSQLGGIIFSWGFLQFIVAFLSFFGFVLTMASARYTRAPGDFYRRWLTSANCS